MPGPLQGLRVLDMTSVVMGPYATQIMGDLGADVIKVESDSGDTLRQNGQGRNPGMGPLFLQMDRSKRSIVLDLKRADGLEAMLALLAGVDVFIFNLRPASMKRIGLGYEVVARANPRIVYCALNGFGEDGPYAGKSAYDDMIQGAAGLPALAARATGEPRYAPSALADRITGLSGLYAVLAALYHREKTGQGQAIEVPMFERMVEFVLSDHLYGLTFDPPIGGSGYPRQLAPDRRPYKTKDGYVCAMPYLDRHWQSFFDMAGLHALKADERFASLQLRTQHIRELYRILADALLTRTSAEWLALFAQADIPSAPLNTPETLLTDPHLEATRFFQMVDHPSEGRIRTMAVPIKFSASKPEVTRQAPRLGEHGREVMEEAGYSAEAIDRLVSSGAMRVPHAAAPGGDKP
jgi:crotonobetainyl-CoA:carnitine CoA-transferase CaiB-like acyl-CoA transferase